MIRGMLEEEMERLIRHQKLYSTKINELPQGSIQLRSIKNGRKYVYLKYREGTRVVQKYIGLPDDEDVKNIAAKIELRKKHEQTLKSIKMDVQLIKKALRTRGSNEE